MSRSLELAKTFLGREVTLVVDRPLGSRHPRFRDLVYRVNYGYVPSTVASDGETLDAYFLGVNEALEWAVGLCVAVIQRQDDDDDKLVVVPEGFVLSDAEIMAAVAFQERFFVSAVVRERTNGTLLPKARFRDTLPSWSG